ncbi:MAG: bifunctional hydroxymethylpyrimidine kinase/phosphomethylpyrimidine kinase [Cellulomonadaceae bacterium]|nr:bifunctional hydroxymethylpyrimidine kinase/phosphomethylpyrimidine kinase [Cellulomonadaceae bacterium]
MIVNALTIAGSDPSGGAGIQADLKTFSALGVYGTTVVTALTAQSTQGVAAIYAVPGAFVTAQLESLLDDVRIDTVKIGMLGTADVIEAVVATLRRTRPRYVVLDPVMAATSGDVLLEPEAIERLRETLLPLVDLITPNVAEAAALLGEPQAASEKDAGDQLRRLGRLCPGVLLTGGHLDGPQSADLLSVDGTTSRIATTRVPTRSTHGTGCTLSAAIAALRPSRPDWTSAVRDAKDYLTAALLTADALDVGHGHGPVHHFHALWPPTGERPGSSWERRAGIRVSSLTVL